MSFLPAFQRVLNAAGEPEKVLVEGKSVLEVPTEQIALVLVDTWNGYDTKPGEPLPEYLQNLRDVLALCRAHNVTIIHAPNRPVVDSYPQYHSLKEELNNYNESAKNKKYLEWGPWGNPVAESAYQLRKHARTIVSDDVSTSMVTRKYEEPPSIAKQLTTSCSVSTSAALYTEGTPATKLDISRFLKPLINEYVLESHEEFRYVLFKHNISTVLYVGGALNECILQRPTGINSLAGTDGNRFPFVIIALEDCTIAMESPAMTADAFKKAMLEYLKFKLAFVSRLSDLSLKSEFAVE